VRRRREGSLPPPSADRQHGTRTRGPGEQQEEQERGVWRGGCRGDAKLRAARSRRRGSPPLARSNSSSPMPPTARSQGQHLHVGQECTGDARRARGKQLRARGAKGSDGPLDKMFGEKICCVAHSSDQGAERARQSVPWQRFRAHGFVWYEPFAIRLRARVTHACVDSVGASLHSV